MANLYPVTITQTRYGGCYEDAPWVAFNTYPECVDSDAFGDDTTCSIWWGDSRNTDKVGRGDSPQAAYDDLASKVQK